MTVAARRAEIMPGITATPVLAKAYYFNFFGGAGGA
jgi:hypothetical protein